MATGEMTLTGEDALHATAAEGENVFAMETVLLERLRSGEREAFEQLVTSYHGLVYGLALRLLNEVEEARDATQETFLKVFRHLKYFRGESGLKTWIYRIAINEISNHQRWWRVRQRKSWVSIEGSDDDRVSLASVLPSQERNPEEASIARQQHVAILHAIQKLRMPYRTVVILRDVEDLSYEEIAGILHLSVGTVKSRLARGREELRKRLEKYL